MTTTELQRKLDELMALPAETEWAEFKQAAGNFHFDDLGNISLRSAMKPI